MKKIITLVCIIALLISAFAVNHSFAEEVPQSAELETVTINSDVNLNGIVTHLVLNIGVSNGNVIGTVKNVISVFPSTVHVYVQLYSSVAYQSSYKTMTLEGENYIDDLNTGKSISTSASIHGVKRYWQVRAYFKIDNNSWQEDFTNVWLVDIDGTATKVQ